jgi:hypothetical protein
MDRGGQVLSKSLWTTLPTLVRPDNIAPVAKGYVATIGGEEYIQNAPSQALLMSLTTDVLLRQEPDDEDDEQDEEDEDNEEDDDEEGDDNEDDDGYSE